MTKQARTSRLIHSERVRMKGRVRLFKDVGKMRFTGQRTQSRRTRFVELLDYRSILKDFVGWEHVVIPLPDCLDLIAEKMAVHAAKMRKAATNECETILKIFDIF